MAITVRLTQDSVKPYDKIYIIQSGLKLDKNLRVRNTKEKRIWEAVVTSVTVYGENEFLPGAPEFSVDCFVRFYDENWPNEDEELVHAFTSVPGYLCFKTKEEAKAFLDTQI